MSKLKNLFYALLMLGLTAVFIYVGNNLSKNEYSNEPISKTAFYLDTFVSLQIYDTRENYNDTIKTKEDLIKVVDNAIGICGHYELYFSKTNVNSELYKLNNGSKQNVRISKELYDIIEKALYYSKLSNGKFDITVSGLSDIWSFKNAVVPDTALITQQLEYVDYNNIVLSELNGNYYISVKNDAQLDLGGIAKGFIADKIKFYLINHGIECGIINLGGNMIVLGDKPDHTKYTIGIQKPFGEDGEIICNVRVIDKSVVTSGIYERMFEENDTIYHHIIDPDTGYPADTGLTSATIISDESIDGDSLSTTCILLGFSDALELINSIDGVECILITSDNQIIISDGLIRSGKIVSLK